MFVLADCLEDNDATEKITEENFISRFQSDSENLMGRVANSEEETYKLYNDYAIKIGFSIRRSKAR